MNFTNDFRRWMPMLEADGGDGGGGNANGEDSTSGNEAMTFDEMLASNPEYQKEFDRRQTKGINTAVTKERDRLKALHDSQLNEAERLAKMNEDEKRQYLDQKKDKEIASLKAAMQKMQLEAQAKTMLAEKGLPISFSSVLNFSDANSVKASIEALEKEWAPAIENIVNEKLKGGRPPKDARTEGSMPNKDEELKKLIYAGLGIKTN